MSKTLPYGAQWVRADFHLHTITDPGKSRQFRKEYQEKENSFNKDWIAKLVKNDIKVAVVTNHNHFDIDAYKNLRKLGNREGILILPGVELGISGGKTGVHTLITFDPDSWVLNQENDDTINRFLGSVFTQTPDEGSNTRQSLPEILELLDSYDKDYFITFAHVDTGNGLLDEYNWKTLEELVKACGERWPKRVLAFQKLKTPSVLDDHWSKFAVKPALVEGSDPKAFDEVGCSDRKCYLKLGELSYSSVEFALRDHQQRVKPTPPEPNPLPRITKVHFEGGLLNGRQFPLSHELNCLIGSRGSGKSSFVECLRYGLSLSAEEDARYKDDLVKAMMGNGGKITIEGLTGHNQAFTITRIYGNEPIVFLEGSESRLRPKDILPNVLYFGQKDLGIRHDNFESDFFEKILTPDSIEDKDAEDSLIRQLQQAVNDWRSVKSAVEKEKSYEQELEQLKHKLDLFRQKGVESSLERLTKFDTDKNRLIEFLEQLRHFRHDLGLESSNWGDFADDWLELKTPELASISIILQQALIEFKALESEHSAVLAKVDQLIEKLNEQLKRVLEKEKELQEEFAAIQREVNQPGLDLDEFRRLKHRHEQLVKILQAAKDRGGASKSAIEKVRSLARKLQETRRGTYTKRYTELQQKQGQLPSSLKLNMEYEANNADFEQFLKSKLIGTGFRKVSYEIICQNYANGFQLFERYKELKDLLNGSADVDKLINAITENLFEFLSYQVTDKKEILYDGTSVRELSLGQRATALLQLLMSLNEQSILIIDQPEDDLDNETVYKQVVTPLLDKKKQTQFIIATHNPNIPVLGDAEQVHACHEESKGIYNHISGSLDSRVTRNSIVNIMEGGEEAFKQRKKIYYQWTNSN